MPDHCGAMPDQALDRLDRIISGTAREADLAWLGECRDAMKRGEDANRALGLVRTAGQRVPQTLDAEARRNDWLRRWWRELLADKDEWRAAGKIASAVERFKTRNWPRDRHLAAVPQQYAGLGNWYAWHAFRARDTRFPSSQRGIYRILASRGVVSDPEGH